MHHMQDLQGSAMQNHLNEGPSSELEKKITIGAIIGPKARWAPIFHNPEQNLWRQGKRRSKCLKTGPTTGRNVVYT